MESAPESPARHDLSRHDLSRMQSLAREVYARRPELIPVDATVGGLAWAHGLAGTAPGETWRHRLWTGPDDRVLAWGWAVLDADARLLWLVHPDRPDLFDEVLVWFDTVADPAARRLLIPRAADHDALTRLAAHGYEPDPVLNHEDNIAWRTQFNRRPLDDLEPVPALPEGFRFADAAESGPAGPIQAHRAAWDSARYTAAVYAQVCGTAPYRADLHVLVQAPDGTYVVEALVWLDDQTGTAEFEPVGTHPEYRRRGLARALLLHAMHLARAAGAGTMLVGCSASARNPAPKALYLGLGFREFTRDVPHRRRAGSES